MISNSFLWWAIRLFNRNGYNCVFNILSMRLSAGKLFSIIFLCFFSVYEVLAAEPCKPVGLKTEYLVNPLGLDTQHPRFTWYLQDSRQGAKQTAYHIYIGTDSAALAAGKANIWIGAKENSSASLVTYVGKALQPFTKYYWKVSVWDKDGRQSSSAIASFEMGMMRAEN